MRAFFQYFENFFFRAFNFSGRASPLEFWCVMPLIWIVILALLPGDAAEFWSSLLARQVPPLNPLYYDSILVFVLTIVPRLSLTVRRLHDSGKSGKWAKLPFIAIFSSITLALGIGSALLTSSVAGNEAVLGLAVLAALVMGSAESAWDGIFAAAIAANSLGWDVIWATLSDMTGGMPKPQLAQGVGDLAQSVKSDPGIGIPAILVTMLMVCTPVVSALLHLMFMLAPTKYEEDGFGGMLDPAPMRKTGGSSAPGIKRRDPLQSYACLFERSPEQEAALKVRQKQELKDLYRTRVLGQG